MGNPLIFLVLMLLPYQNTCFFPSQPQCCLSFSRIELQMLFRCCFIHVNIIILRHILYLVYLCLSLGLGLFMLYLCDLCFIFSLVFIVINNITSLKQTHLFFTFFTISPNIFRRRKQIIFKRRKFRFRALLGFCLIFWQFQPAVAYKSVAYKKNLTAYFYSNLYLHCVIPCCKNIFKITIVISEKSGK